MFHAVSGSSEPPRLTHGTQVKSPSCRDRHTCKLTARAPESRHWLLTLLPGPHRVEQTPPPLACTDRWRPSEWPCQKRVCWCLHLRTQDIHKHLLSTCDIPGTLLGALSILIHWILTTAPWGIYGLKLDSFSNSISSGSVIRDVIFSQKNHLFALLNAALRQTFCAKCGFYMC